MVKYGTARLTTDDNIKRRRKDAVAQLIEALPYKPEGHGFDSRWCHWNFSLTYSFRPHYDPCG
jgi:hypothetical protein